MTVEITLQLTENLIARAVQLGSATHRDVDAVIADALELLWFTLEGVPNLDRQSPIAELPDHEVLSLANTKMDEIQNQRLGYLQTKGKATGITNAERYELFALLQIYQLGQIRKSEAMAEAVGRGLRNPLSA